MKRYIRMGSLLLSNVIPIYFILEGDGWQALIRKNQAYHGVLWREPYQAVALREASECWQALH